MSVINIKSAQQNLYKLVNDVNVGFNPITILNNKGKNAVLISEDEWNNISETLYLYSVPGFVKSIVKSKTEPKETRTKHIPGETW